MKSPIVTAETKAKTIDLTKDKIILGSLALLAGFMALAVFSSSSSEAKVPTWSSYSVGEDEVKLPFKFKSQKLGH